MGLQTQYKPKIQNIQQKTLIINLIIQLIFAMPTSFYCSMNNLGEFVRKLTFQIEMWSLCISINLTKFQAFMEGNWLGCQRKTLNSAIYIYVTLQNSMKKTRPIMRRLQLRLNLARNSSISQFWSFGSVASEESCTHQWLPAISLAVRSSNFTLFRLERILPSIHMVLTGHSLLPRGWSNKGLLHAIPPLPNNNLR